MAQDSEGNKRRYEQPHPGASGHEEATDTELPVDPEVVEVDDEGTPAEQSEQSDQESKHSYPTSDPPANY